MRMPSLGQLTDANAGTVNYRAGKFYCTNVCGVLLSNEVTANQMIAEALKQCGERICVLCW